jgi:hypothetical protein
MIQPDPIELEIEVSAQDATDEDLDKLTRQLLGELREADVESAELAKSGSSPQGTKSVDPVTIGSIVVAVAPTVLPKVLEMAQAWATRGQGRTVKFKGKVNGQMIEFEGHAQDFEKLVASLSKGRKKK